MQKQNVSETGSQVFYAAPSALARLLCSVLLGMAAFLYAVLFFLMPVTEALSLLPAVLPLMGVGVVCETAFAFLLSRRSPIWLDAVGITCTNFWGCKRTLTWGEIQSAAPVRCLSLPCLKVSSFRTGHSGTMLLPLYVTCPQAFGDSIRAFASPIHPVRRFLEAGVSEPRESEALP